MEDVQKIVETISETIADLADSDVVVGSPRECGSVTIVPISRIAAGFGGGEGQGKAGPSSSSHDHGGEGRGAGTAGGAHLRPVAVAVFRAGGVEILPIADRQNRLETFLEQLPELAERRKLASRSRKEAC